MSALPSWLSPLVRLEDFKGDSDAYLKALFSIFERDFVTSSPEYDGKPVLYDKGDDNGKPRAFVHVTTEEDKQSGDRVLSLRRCERIAWIRPIIEHHDDPAILVWKKEQVTNRRKALRVYFFFAQEDFLLILEKLKHGHYLITAIYVDNPRQKEKHLKAHQKYTQNGAI